MNKAGVTAKYLNFLITKGKQKKIFFNCMTSRVSLSSDVFSKLITWPSGNGMIIKI